MGRKAASVSSDWRNRKKWDAYESAVCDMVDRTSTQIAPWTLVEADNKKAPKSAPAADAKPARRRKTG